MRTYIANETYKYTLCLSKWDSAARFLLLTITTTTTRTHTLHNCTFQWNSIVWVPNCCCCYFSSFHDGFDTVFVGRKQRLSSSFRFTDFHSSLFLWKDYTINTLAATIYICCFKVLMVSGRIKCFVRHNIDFTLGPLTIDIWFWVHYINFQYW